MPAHLLVIATAPDPADELRDRVRQYVDKNAEVLLVAPASDVSLLQWLTGEEDRARDEAEDRARQTADAVPATVVDVQAGELDPVTAVEDALRTFPAEELVVVTRPEWAATWLEKDAMRELRERFGLPVRHLVDDDVELKEARAGDEPSPPKPVEKIAHEVVHGRSPWTGFLVANAVLLVVGTVAAVLIAGALLLYFALR